MQETTLLRMSEALPLVASKIQLISERPGLNKLKTPAEDYQSYTKQLQAIYKNEEKPKRHKPMKSSVQSQSPTKLASSSALRKSVHNDLLIKLEFMKKPDKNIQTQSQISKLSPYLSSDALMSNQKLFQSLCELRNPTKKLEKLATARLPHINGVPNTELKQHESASELIDDSVKKTSDRRSRTKLKKSRSKTKVSSHKKLIIEIPARPTLSDRASNKKRNEATSRSIVLGLPRLPRIQKQATDYQKISTQFQPLSQKEFLSIVRSYNYIQVGAVSHGFYKAYVGPGNNSGLIKKCLKQRGYWLLQQAPDESTNLVWTQLKVEEYSNSIKEKLPQNQNPLNQPAKDQEWFGEVVQGYLKYRTQESPYLSSVQSLMSPAHFRHYINKVVKASRKNQNNHSKAVYKVRDFLDKRRPKVRSPLLIQNPHQIKMHNHIDYSSALGNKKGLLYHMKIYYQSLKMDPFQVIPQTVHMENTSSSVSIQSLKDIVTFGLPCILKPGELTNRGNGITVHTTWETLKDQISKCNLQSQYNRSHIIQRYLLPFLYRDRKFDIRMWVLWNGRQAWWYKQGYIRTSCKPFDIKSPSKYVHLTNDAIQKFCEDYGKHQSANKISFGQFNKYLLEKYQGKYDFYGQVYPQIRRITHDVFRVANFTVNKNNKALSFELFGLDFMIDSEFKTWLIEVNTNPCLETGCTLLTRLISNMVEGVITLAIDPIFVAPQFPKRRDNWGAETHKFQLLYDGYEETTQSPYKEEELVQYKEQQQEFQDANE